MQNTAQVSGAGCSTISQPLVFAPGQRQASPSSGHHGPFGENSSSGGYATAHLQAAGIPPTQQVCHPPTQPPAYPSDQTGGYRGMHGRQHVGGYPTAQHLVADHHTIQQAGYPTTQPTSHQVSHITGYALVPCQTQHVAYNYLPTNQSTDYLSPTGSSPATGGYHESSNEVPRHGQCQAQLLIVRTATEADWNARKVFLPEKHLVVLGVQQLLCGVISIVLSAAAMHVSAFLNVIGYGFWCGLLAILAGVFGVAAGKTRGKCLLITATVSSFILIFAIWVQIACASVAIEIDSRDLHCLMDASVQSHYHSIAYMCTRTYMTSLSESSRGHRMFNGTSDDEIKQSQMCLVVDALLLLVGFAEFAVAIWSSSIGFRFSCCRGCSMYCCTCYPILDSTTNMDVFGPRYQQIMFENDQQMMMFLNVSQMRLQGTENIALPPYTVSAVDGQDMTSPPPYSVVTSPVCGETLSAETTEPKDDDEQQLLCYEIPLDENNYL